MKKIILICIVEMLLSACSIATEKESGSNNKSLIKVDVTEVIDGDTIKVNLNSKEETVRLLLVDTPETKHPRLGVQPYGPEASEFTKKELSNQTIDIELGISERDKYGRVLAYVYKDGAMFNQRLLEEGLARVAYVYAPNTKYLDELEDAQRLAQEKKKGIWSIENYANEDNVSQDCADPLVKGNVSSGGEKIYHLPGGQSYEQTKAEELFCSEEAAVEAGYRKSKR